MLWVSNGQYAPTDATDWTGKISRLSGPDLGTYQDYVTNLPRSVRDHLNNQIAFGPDGALYFSQASNSSMGAADPIWGNRPEHLLNAAILARHRRHRHPHRQRPGPAERPDREQPDRHELQPVRRRRAADDLRHRRAQRVRPRLDAHGQPLRADQRLGRRRQHARVPQQHLQQPADRRHDLQHADAFAYQRQPDRRRLPLQDHAGRLLRPPQPRRAGSTSSTAATPPAAPTRRVREPTPSAPSPTPTTAAPPTTSARTTRPTASSSTRAAPSTAPSTAS